VPAKRIAEAQLPADPVKRWQTVIPVVEDLKVKAKCVYRELLVHVFAKNKYFAGPRASGTCFSARSTTQNTAPRSPTSRSAPNFSSLSLLICQRLQYAVMAEILGRTGHIASEAMNCSAPDTGNMG
jgi:acyl-CoA dehydrogenase